MAEDCAAPPRLLLAGEAEASLEEADDAVFFEEAASEDEDGVDFFLLEEAAAPVLMGDDGIWISGSLSLESMEFFLDNIVNREDINQSAAIIDSRTIRVGT